MAKKSRKAGESDEALEGLDQYEGALEGAPGGDDILPIAAGGENAESRRKAIALKAATPISPSDIEVVKADNISRWDAEDQGDDYVHWLGYDMSINGNTDPVNVRRDGGRLWLVSGFNRHEAALRIISGYDYVTKAGETVRVHQPDFKLKALLVNISKEEAAKANVRENAKKKPLTPMDYANIVRHYEDVLGMGATEIAEELGCDASYVSQYRKLLLLPKRIQSKVHNGTLPARAAMAMVDMEEGERTEAMEAHELWEKSEGKEGERLTHSKVASKLRDRVAATGKGKVISRTSADIRKFFDTMSGPGEDPAIQRYAKFVIEWIKATKTDKQHENELYRLLSATESEDAGKAGKQRKGDAVA